MGGEPLSHVTAARRPASHAEEAEDRLRVRFVWDAFLEHEGVLVTCFEIH